MIGGTINNPNPSSNELDLGQQLAVAYADLANREIVLNATKKALGVNELPDHYAQALPNTQLIEISVDDTDPQRAQIVANELANQLIHLGPVSGQSERLNRQDFIHERLNNLEAQINQTEAEIEKLQGDLANTFSAQEINDLQNQISSLQAKLSTMENNYGVLLSNTQQGATNTLTVIASAELPTRPIGPVKGLSILLAAVVGFVLAACEAYLLEYLDDSLKSPDVVERLFSAPIIGHILEHADQSSEDRLYNAEKLEHPLTEPLRALRTAIDFVQTDQPLKTILVSSPDVGDGKSSVAANLALAMAQRDQKVFLLDADLRKPRIHELFNLSNDQGVADLAFASTSFDWKSRIKEVGKLSILPAGHMPPDTAGLLSSEKMNLLLSEVEASATVVIIDGPPLFVADSMILAAKADGVLLVVRPSHTRRSLAKSAAEHIQLVGAKVIGVVLNRIPVRGADYYAGKNYLYTYYRSTYGNEGEFNEKNAGLRKLREILSPYANKMPDFLKYLLKLSPK
jgi:non-specific protein-tyrosine kinase